MFAHVCARRLAGVHVSPRNVNRPEDFLPADQTEERSAVRGREAEEERTLMMLTVRKEGRSKWGKERGGLGSEEKEKWTG